MKRKFDASIDWLEIGIEYYRNLLRRMMHKEIRKVYRENALEFEKAIEVLKQESAQKKSGVTEEFIKEKTNRLADMIIDYTPSGQKSGKPIELNELQDFIHSLVEKK